MKKLRYFLGLMKEFALFARENKVYWLLPMVLILVLMAVLIFVGQSATPFIYTLF